MDGTKCASTLGICKDGMGESSESKPHNVAASDSLESLRAQNSDRTKRASLAEAARQRRRVAGQLSSRLRVAAPCERQRCKIVRSL